MSRVPLNNPGDLLNDAERARIRNQVRPIRNNPVLKRQLLEYLDRIEGSVAPARGEALLDLNAAGGVMGFNLDPIITAAQARVTVNLGAIGLLPNDPAVIDSAVREEVATVVQTEWNDIMTYINDQQTVYNNELNDIGTAITNLDRDVEALANTIPFGGLNVNCGGVPATIPELPATLLPFIQNAVPGGLNNLYPRGDFNNLFVRRDLTPYLNQMYDIATQIAPQTNAGRNIIAIIDRIRASVADMSTELQARDTAYRNIMGIDFNGANVEANPDRFNPDVAIPRLHGNVNDHLNAITPPSHPRRVQINFNAAAVAPAPQYTLMLRNKDGGITNTPANQAAFDEWILTNEPDLVGPATAPTQDVLARNYLRAENLDVNLRVLAINNDLDSNLPGSILSEFMISGFALDPNAPQNYANAIMNNGAIVGSAAFGAGGIPGAPVTDAQILAFAAAVSDASRTPDVNVARANAIAALQTRINDRLTQLRASFVPNGPALNVGAPYAPAARPASDAETCAFLQYANVNRTTLTPALRALAVAMGNDAHDRTIISAGDNLDEMIANELVGMASGLNNMAEATASANMIITQVGTMPTQAGRTQLLNALAYRYNVPTTAATTLAEVQDLVRDAIRDEIITRIPGPRLDNVPNLQAQETIMRDNYARNLGRYVPNMINVFQGSALRANVEATRAAHINARSQLTAGLVMQEMNVRATAGAPLNLTVDADRVAIANLIIDNVLAQRAGLMNETRNQYNAYQNSSILRRTDWDETFRQNRGRYTLATLGVGAVGLGASVLAPVLAIPAAGVFAAMTGFGAWRSTAGIARRTFDFFRSRRNRQPEELQGVQTAPNVYNQANAMADPQYQQHMSYHMAMNTKTHTHVERNPAAMAYTTGALEGADRARLMHDILPQIDAGVLAGDTREEILQDVITDVINTRENNLLANVEQEKRTQRVTNIISETVGAVAGIGAAFGAMRMFDSAHQGITHWFGWDNPKGSPLPIHPPYQPVQPPVQPPIHPGVPVQPPVYPGPGLPGPVPPYHPGLPGGEQVNLHIPNDAWSVANIGGDKDPGLFQLLQKDFGINQTDFVNMQNDGTWNRFLQDNPILQGRSAIDSRGVNISGIDFVKNGENLNGNALANWLTTNKGVNPVDIVSKFKHA